MRRPIVAGLDLSLTGTGVAIVDGVRWARKPDLLCVWTNRFGFGVAGKKDLADHEARVDRLVQLVDLVVDMLVEREVTHVWVENYSFGMAHNAHQLGEIGGCMKREIRKRTGLVAIPVSNSSARKLFLGRGTGKGIKAEVQRQLRLMDAPFEGDEGDAFVVANWGLAELGLPALSLAKG